MTDGIIQKVFKNYDFVVCSNEHYKSIMKRLQQELIEKIKQADTKNPDWDYNFSIGVKLMKIYLIGDNND